MDVSECPWCGLVNPPEAQRCDCGYDFTTGDFEGSYITKASQLPSAPVNAGLSPLVILFGWLGVLVAIFVDMLRSMAALARISSLPRADGGETASEIAQRLPNSSGTAHGGPEQTNVMRPQGDAEARRTHSAGEPAPLPSPAAQEAEQRRSR